MRWWIDSDAIVFDAVLDRGVPSVTEEMSDLADKIAESTNRKITGVGGNFNVVRFKVDKEFTPEEADRIEK